MYKVYESSVLSTPTWFSALVTRGNNFNYFLTVFLEDKTLSNGVYS